MSDEITLKWNTDRIRTLTKRWETLQEIRNEEEPGLSKKYWRAFDLQTRISIQIGYLVAIGRESFL